MTVHTLGPQLIALLGLPKHCVSFELRCAVGEIVTVKCEYYPEDADGVDTVLAEYELVPRTKLDDAKPHPSEVIGFDSWMRERTEAAHQAMMKHARRGGIDYSKKYATGGIVTGWRLVGESA
ncbi:hypothetical protein [Janthinobacterium sp. HLS12-2]|uniref:hypothetical protein n=1 Tax=Janthinobacterium sp. HLS12-2 TaxID=1259324 RepID=UPI003F25FB80